MEKHPNVKTLEELLPLIEEARNAGKIIVSTNGCFDIIHPGHASNLEWAKAQGDVLVVGVNSDASVVRNKGVKRPIVSESDRAYMIASLRPVDYVLLFDEDTPAEWLRLVRPHVHIKGAGSETDPMFKTLEALVNEGGGEVRLAPLVEERSTTSIIDRILGRYT